MIGDQLREVWILILFVLGAGAAIAAAALRLVGGRTGRRRIVVLMVLGHWLMCTAALGHRAGPEGLSGLLRVAGSALIPGVASGTLFFWLTGRWRDIERQKTARFFARPDIVEICRSNPVLQAKLRRNPDLVSEDVWVAVTGEPRPTACSRAEGETNDSSASGPRGRW